MRALALALLLAGAGTAGPAVSQDLSLGQVQSPVLVIDVDRLVAESRYGRRLDADVAAGGEALAAENARIAAELTAEERSLTERRPAMAPDAFRAEAEAFDARVQRVRAEQDGKQRALEAQVAEGRQTLLTAARPALGQLMADSGAAVILDRRDTLLWATAVDVTDEAIAAIDAALGDGPPAGDAPGAEPGGSTEPPEPSPDGAPGAAPDLLSGPAPDPMPEAAEAPGGG